VSLRLGRPKVRVLLTGYTSEGRALCVGDYDAKGGVIDVRETLQNPSSLEPIRGQTKTGAEGLYPVPGDLREWIARNVPAPARFDPAAPLFPNPRTGRVWRRGKTHDVWRDACTTATVPYISLYRATKHSGLTALSEAGYSLEDVQAMARHKDARTTQIYILDDDKKRARAAEGLRQFLDDARE
jgi:integrase